MSHGRPYATAASGNARGGPCYVRPAICLLASLAACHTSPSTHPAISPRSLDTPVRFQAISTAGSHVAWVSGTHGTFARTVDRGGKWDLGVVPGADSLEFRDVHAVDSLTAYLLSAGPGAQSRIYKTGDGGRTWALQFVNDVAEGFFDCFDFWDPWNGLAFSDAVDGEFILMATHDGETWNRIPPSRVPDALPGEGGFAASGTCLVAWGDSTAWFGTGAAQVARIFRTDDRGRNWSVSPTPIAAGPMSGITSVAFRDDMHGVAVGGVIGDTTRQSNTVAVTDDGGRHWVHGGSPPIPGPPYGVAYVPGSTVLLAVGPGGASLSADDGRTWSTLNFLNHWALALVDPALGWAVGPAGRITAIRF